MVKSFTDSDLYTPKKRLGIEEQKTMQGILAWFFVVTPTGSRFYFIKVLFLNICDEF